MLNAVNELVIPKLHIHASNLQELVTSKIPTQESLVMITNNFFLGYGTDGVLVSEGHGYVTSCRFLSVVLLEIQIATAKFRTTAMKLMIISKCFVLSNNI